MMDQKKVDCYDCNNDLSFFSLFLSLHYIGVSRVYSTINSGGGDGIVSDGGNGGGYY